MFTNFLQLISRRARPEYERSFVEEVRVVHPVPRNRRVEKIFIICWILIGVKSAVVIWAVRHYRIPFSPLWVIAPTVAFAALVTIVYWRRS